MLQLLINQLPSGTVQTIANDALPFVSGYLNDQLLNWAPSFVGDIITVGNDFGDMAKKFGINETYVVTKGSNGNYTAVDTATGVHFTIGTVQEDFNFTDYNATNIVVNGVPVAMDRHGQDHDRRALARPAIRQDPQHRPRRWDHPARRPERDEPPTLFADEIDCNSVGAYVEQAIENDIGIDLGSGVFVTACTDGLNAGANLIYSSSTTSARPRSLRPRERHRQGRRHQRRPHDRPDQHGRLDRHARLLGRCIGAASTATFTGKRM